MKFYKSIIYFSLIVIIPISLTKLSISQKKIDNDTAMNTAYKKWYNDPKTEHMWEIILEYDYKSSYSYKTYYDRHFTRKTRYRMTKEAAIEDTKDWLRIEEPTARNIHLYRATIID